MNEADLRKRDGPPWHHRKWVRVVGGIALVVASVAAISLATAGRGEEDERGWGSVLFIAGIVTTPLALVGLALVITSVARRSATRALEHGAEESPLLTIASLRRVRALMWLVFVAVAVWFVADGLALWDEAHELETSNEYGDSVPYYGLTIHERRLLTGSVTTTPNWYPVFVVARQVVLDLAAFGVALLLFSRRPRHWMAYLSTLFILLSPAMGYLSADSYRLDGTNFETLDDLLGLGAFATLAAFLWLFPDGRFRSTFVRYVAALIGLFSLAVVVGAVTGSDDFVETAGWMTFVLGFLTFASGGVALQVWRYRHTPLENRRLARWNLVLLAAIPLWFLPFGALHDVVGSKNEADDTRLGFAWEQVHETLYLAAPVLMGLWVLHLVRRQGWWDFETLWNRTAVYGIGLGALAGLYGAAFAVVSLAASPLAETGEQAVAVVAATAAVAFAYGPLIGRVRRWVDQRWFPRRVQGALIASAFGDDLRRLPTPEVVPDRLLDTVCRSLDTDDATLWLPKGAAQ